MSNAIFTISCPDQKGITASLTNFVYQNNGNIIHADQHIDPQTNTFFMRLEWALHDFAIKRADIASAIQPLAQKFKMQWNLNFTDHRPRVAIFVSKNLHCLHDLLFRIHLNQLPCEPVMIISNHPLAQTVAKQFDIKFLEFVVLKENKTAKEKDQIKILKENQIDLIILARYMQILSPQFIAQFPFKIINIHHSFLPAFIGANPYAKAYQKGVKIIGATSHYVTEQLDEGPIIEQDIIRVSHRDTIVDLQRKSEDLERLVLSRAVLWHLENKILVYNNKTVIFD